MANVNQQAFEPVPASTVNMTAGVASANVQYQTGNFANAVRVVNAGSVTVFLEFGGSAVAATTTTGMPVVAGATEIFYGRRQYVAAITASGSAVIYFTPGEGL